MACGDDVSVGREGSLVRTLRTFAAAMTRYSGHFLHTEMVYYRRSTDVLCIVLLQRVDPPPPMAQKPFPNRPTPQSSRPPLGISCQSRKERHPTPGPDQLTREASRRPSDGLT